MCMDPYIKYCNTGIVPYIKKAVSNACRVIIRSEKTLNQLDTQSGDGDCGTTMKRGADGKKSLASCCGRSLYRLVLDVSSLSTRGHLATWLRYGIAIHNV